MNNPSKPNGLREQIASAKTIDEVNALLSTGKTMYRVASLKTVRSWHATAARRIQELERKTK